VKVGSRSVPPPVPSLLPHYTSMSAAILLRGASRGASNARASTIPSELPANAFRSALFVSGQGKSRRPLGKPTQRLRIAITSRSIERAHDEASMREGPSRAVPYPATGGSEKSEKSGSSATEAADGSRMLNERIGASTGLRKEENGV